MPFYRQPPESIELSPSVVFQKSQPPMNKGGVHTMFRHKLLIAALWNLCTKTLQEWIMLCYDWRALKFFNKKAKLLQSPDVIKPNVDITKFK